MTVDLGSYPAIVLLAMSVSSVSATYTYIAGYEPRSTVITHANIDKDTKAIMTHSDWPIKNSKPFKDCAANACNWNSSATMYPTVPWDTDCTHTDATVSTTPACVRVRAERKEAARSRP